MTGSTPAPRYTVLVVDDDPDVLMIARLSLTPHAQLDVKVARSGVECVERHLQGEVWDAVILDWMMPTLDGLATLEKLRKNGYRGPCALFTAAVEPVDISKVPVDIIIAKPFDPLTLPDRVLALFRQHE